MFRPRADYILVKTFERKGSSIIATVLHEHPNIGEVVAIGPGKRNPKTGNLKPLDVKVGQIVRFMEWKNMFPEWRETPEGPLHIIIQEADIAGIEEQHDIAA